MYLGNGRNRINVRMTGRLHTDEREDESKDQGKDSFTDIHAEQGGEDSATHNCAASETDSPPEEGDTVCERCLIFIFGIYFLGTVEHFTDADFHVGKFLRGLNDMLVLIEEAKNGTIQRRTLDEGTHRKSNIGERVYQHDEDTGPQEPISWRGICTVVVQIFEGKTLVREQRVVVAN